MCFRVMIGIVLLTLTVRRGAGPGSSRLVERLVHEFHAKLGIDLHARQSAKLPGFPSGVALEPSPEAQKRFGDFHILVLASPSEAKRLVHGRRPDARGIYWGEVSNELSNDPPYWAARKLYGRVLLKWWNSKRRVNDDWRRLDDAVREAVGAGE